MSKSNIKVIVHAVLSVLLITFSFGIIGVYPFHAWRLEYISVPDVRNGSPVPICANFERRIVGDFGTDLLINLLFYILVCSIPQFIIVVNYWKIFKTIRGVARRKNTSLEFRTNWREREIFFMKQAVMLFLLFFVFRIPMAVSFLLPILYDGVGPDIQSTTSHLTACAFYFAEVIISPLIQRTTPEFFKGRMSSKILKIFPFSKSSETNSRSVTTVHTIGSSVNT